MLSTPLQSSRLADGTTPLAELAVRPRLRSRWRPGLSLAGCLGLCFTSGCGGEEPRPGVHPRHVLLVTAEGVRADHFSAYMYHQRTTRILVDGGVRAAGRALSLDDLADEGVLFARAYSPSSQAAGALAALHGLRREGSQAQDGASLAEQLAAEGVVTAAFVSTAARPENTELNRGFGTFRLFEEVTAAGYPPDDAALGGALDWISSQDWGDGAARFLWLHVSGPDLPFEPPTLAGEVFHGRWSADLEDGEAKLSAEYDEELLRLNSLLYRVLDQYQYEGRAFGVWPNTCFLFAGVNGMQLGEHGSVGVGHSLYECELRVPMIVRHPDSITGSRVFSDVVDLLDVAPTVREVLGLEPRLKVSLPGASSGLGAGVPRSLLARIDSYRPREFRARAAIARNQGGLESIRTERWRLVRGGSSGQSEPPALYDHNLDPGERFNVASEWPEVVAELNAMLDGKPLPGSAGVGSTGGRGE